MHLTQADVTIVYIRDLLGHSYVQVTTLFNHSPYNCICFRHDAISVDHFVIFCTMPPAHTLVRWVN